MVNGLIPQPLLRQAHIVLTSIFDAMGFSVSVGPLHSRHGARYLCITGDNAESLRGWTVVLVSCHVCPD